MIKCGVCGRIKEKVNHWWTIEYLPSSKSMYIYPWDMSLTNELEVPREWKQIHVCGIECCSKAESKIKLGEDPERKIPQ